VVTLSSVTFNQALNRLEEISERVRKKEVSLDDSLELLEESVKLASFCNQHIDYTAWIPESVDETAGEDVIDR
jgi:exodeoxyribonuclease VII small subunit